MKKLIMVLILAFSSNLTISQTTKIDTLIGKNGVLKRFIPKEISNGQKLSFNIRLIYTLKDKSGKEMEACSYLNTKYGYIGIIPSTNGDYSFNPNDKNFKLLVYSNSMQNFMFNTSKKGKKTMMVMPTIPKNEFKMEEVIAKKENTVAKKYTNLNIDAYSYNNSKTNANEKVTMYLSDANLGGKLNYQNKISYAGMGFYQINGKTIIILSIENNDTKITLNKIESVNVSLNSANFTMEESGFSNEAIEAIMKKLKKN